MSENGLHKISAMRTALVAIQELHKPARIIVGQTTGGEWVRELLCVHCTRVSAPGTYFPHPCATRKLADEGLAGEERG